MSKDLLLIAITASLEAGHKILSVYEHAANTGVEISYKTDQSPLTLADLLSNQAILVELEGSGLPVLSEESGQIPFQDRKSWNRFWLVDPLDGTKEFINRNGEFTVNIALIEDQKPVMGVIYVPVTDVLYFGDRQGGSYRLQQASQKISHYLDDGADVTYIRSISEKLPLEGDHRPFTIVASRSHLSPETELIVEKYRAEKGKIQFISKGSSLKICLVAEGTADLYPRLAPTMEWDTAAGQAIAENAGCRVTVHPGNQPVQYNKENLLNPHFIVGRS